jgi:menaquinone-dependent protoporphyrinogen IX oxidase
MKTLVLYYSNTGNNRYLAKRCSTGMDADLEEIHPRLGMLPFLIIFSLLKWSPGIRRLHHDVTAYDCIILCGPIWMGQLIIPLRAFLKQYRAKVKTLAFITCCGGGDEMKDDKFGYAAVFKEVERLSDGKPVLCEAFPVGYILPEEKRTDNNAMMQARLSDDNFTGAFRNRLDVFIEKVKG